VIHGFLNIDKPAGITSHDLVARVRRIVRQRRVGHAGTLDPAATGVLVVALGGATRLIEYVQELTAKRYYAVVRLGATTTTDDAEGELLDSAPVPELDPAALDDTLALFRGTIMQVPPMYSALHHDGQRLYDLARAGVVVERPARPVVIERLELLDWSPPLLTLDVQCSKGTYIRSLARDLGAALMCGGHLQALRRTAVGAFYVNQAIPLGDLEADPAVLPSHVLPPDYAVRDWAAITLDADATRRARNGQPLNLPEQAGDRLRAYSSDGALLALLVRVEGQWKPEKVFDWATA
jgi:tRNA pseudouridine55 synthase